LLSKSWRMGRIPVSVVFPAGTVRLALRVPSPMRREKETCTDSGCSDVSALFIVLGSCLYLRTVGPSTARYALRSGCQPGKVLCLPPYRKIRDRMGHPFRASA